MADSWVPGWEIRRFTDPKSGAANANRVACAHTIVGGLPGAWHYGNTDGNPYPHSYIEGDGHGINAQPVNLRAAANLDGNPYCWSIETEDVDSRWFPSWNLKCGEVPAWTDAQLETLTGGMAWWCLRYQRPPVLIPDTLPGRVGLAYHRQGVPGSPEWVTGADRWSTSVGKCCPDWRRIHQFKTEVVPAVAQLVDPQEEDVTPEQAAQLDKIERRLDVVYDAYRWKAAHPETVWSGNLPGRADVLYAALEGGDDVDEAAVAAAVLAGLDVEAIAAAIPDTIATNVADKLHERLAG